MAEVVIRVLHGLIDWFLFINIAAIFVAGVALVVTGFTPRATAATRHAIQSAAVLVMIFVIVISFFMGLHMARAADGTNNNALLIHKTATESGSVTSANVRTVCFWIGIIMLTGSVLVMLYFITGRILGYLACRKSQQLDDDHELVLSVTRLAESCGVRRKCMVLISDNIRVPVVFGAVFPKIIIPKNYPQITRESGRALLLHECAHIVRLDILLQTAFHLLAIFTWINPLIWQLGKRLKREREKASDDFVIELGIDAGDYARQFMDAAKPLGTAKNPLWAQAAMSEGIDFKERMLSLIDPSVRRKPMSATTKWLLTVVSLVTIISITAFKPVLDTYLLEHNVSMASLYKKELSTFVNGTFTTDIDGTRIYGTVDNLAIGKEGRRRFLYLNPGGSLELFAERGGALLRYVILRPDPDGEHKITFYISGTVGDMSDTDRKLLNRALGEIFLHLDDTGKP